MLLWGRKTTTFHGRRLRLRGLKWLVQSCPASQHQIWCSNPNQSNSKTYTLSHHAKLLFRSSYLLCSARNSQSHLLNSYLFHLANSSSTFEAQFKHQHGQSFPVHHQAPVCHPPSIGWASHCKNTYPTPVWFLLLWLDLDSHVVHQPTKPEISYSHDISVWAFGKLATGTTS